MQLAHKVLDPEGLHFGKITSGNHPDLHIYQPEGKTRLHSIENMRKFVEEANKPPFESVRKVFIFHYAERMLPSSANTLLKTLEEPREDTLIFLLSAHPEEILPTILSRCVRFSLPKTAQEEVSPKVQEMIVNVQKMWKGPYFSFDFSQLDALYEEMEEGKIQEIDPLFVSILELHKGHIRATDILKEARLGLHRGIKLSACIEYLFLTFRGEPCTRLGTFC